MPIDPRILRKTKNEADCHLIPDCFGVSNVTVRLDADFDSKIGTNCDAELQKYYEVFFGDRVTGRIALSGGSKTLKAVMRNNGVFVVPKPKTGTVDKWASRALGLKEGRVQFESFTGDFVDCAAAFVSIVHSAFLVLYWHGRQEIEGPQFDSVRRLFHKSIDRSLTNADHEVVREMIEIQVAFPADKVKGRAITVNDYRTLYDPSHDFGDGLLDDFPKKCLTEEEDSWRVRLPYSRSLRATVTFAAL